MRDIGDSIALFADFHFGVVGMRVLLFPCVVSVSPITTALILILSYDMSIVLLRLLERA